MFHLDKIGSEELSVSELINIALLIEWESLPP